MGSRLLITGSEGQIGQILVMGLLDSYEIYCLDKVIERESRTKYKADVSNYGDVGSVFEKIRPEFIIHLAASTPFNEPWESVLKNNIVGTKNVYEACREYSIRKVIFASSNHVTGMYEGIPPVLHLEENPKMITIRDPIRPDGYYGSSKIFGEALARQYFESYGIESICLRIGTARLHNDPTMDETGRWLKTWITNRDLVQLVRRSLESVVTFGIYYGVSNNTGRFWDISNAETELGYKPEDDASKLGEFK